MSSREAGRILGLASIDEPTHRQESELHELFGNWLEGADVRPAMPWSERPLRVVMTGDTGLSSALALALVNAVVVGGPGLRQCANCTEWFAQTPRQRAAAQVWCTKRECQRAKLATAARDHRRRLRVLSSAA